MVGFESVNLGQLSEKSARERAASIKTQGVLLSGISYPASKADLLDTAQNNGADDEGLDYLRSFPDRIYESPDDVDREIAGFIEFQNYLSGISYPASKADLLDTAQDEGADDMLLDTLRALLPDRIYETPGDAYRAIRRRNSAEHEESRGS